MKNARKSVSIRFPIVIAAGLAASIGTSRAQSASATISGTAAGGGEFDYVITLNNTGSVNLEDFWYGWTSSGNNLPSGPSDAANSLGWANDLSGNSIQWVGNSSLTALQPGQSATFTFESTTTPTAITTSPSGGSVAYTDASGNGIDFSQGVSGDSTGAFYPVLVPEPSVLALLGAGLLLTVSSFKLLALAGRQ